MSGYKKISVLAVIVFALAAGYTCVGSSERVSALSSGVNIISTGTFTDGGAQMGMSIPMDVDTPAEYMAYVDALLHNTAYAGIPGSDYNKYGAAFLVETMVHGRADYSADEALVRGALNDYATWAEYVGQYASAKRINWNHSATLPSGSLNSMHVCIDGPSGHCSSEAVYYDNDQSGGGHDAHKFEFYNMSSPEPSTLIIFKNMDGTTYQIRRECANVIGSAKPLKKIGWSLGGQTTASTASIFANETVTFTNQIKHTGPAAATFDWQVRYCLNACSGGYGAGYETLGSGTATNMSPNGIWNTMLSWKWSPKHGDTSTNICAWIAYSDAAGPGTAEGHGNWTCVTLKPLTPSCGGLVVSPEMFDPTDAYKVTGTVNVVGGRLGAATADADSNFFIHIQGPGVNIAEDNVGPVTIGGSSSTAGNGTLTASISPSPTNNVGTYTIAYGVTGPVSPVTCTGSFAVAYSPYFAVQGGDVAAGPGFGAACTPLLSDIRAKNVGPSKGYYGAGTQLAALSLGRIIGFATNTTLEGGAGSGNSSSGASVPQPSGLAFANAGTSATVWGTTFGKDTTRDPGDHPSWCVPNYVSAALHKVPRPEPLGTTILDQSRLNSLTSGVVYSTTGTTTIAGPLTLGGASPARVTLVVDGDVILKGNITYSAYSYTSGTSSIGVVPQFQLLVKGHIYIDKDVTVLSGLYHAQQRGGDGGTIYTCASGNQYLTNVSADAGPHVLQDPSYYTDCSQQLTVYGSMAAHRVEFLRTGGNWKQTPAVGNQPAEQIIYAPELWLGSASNAASGPWPYDSITNLSPVF